MRTSDERILTTHVGSLPRPDRLLELMDKQQAGESVDPETFESAVRDATMDAIHRQNEVGIDIANNGEQPRAGFHVYVTRRMSGFEGQAEVDLWADLADFPSYADRAFGDVDVQTLPAVTAPIQYEDVSMAQQSINGFFDLLEEADLDFEETFFTAASPGIVTMDFPNEYYDSHEEYLFTLAEELRQEYELIADTDALLQVDAPDLLAGWHRTFQDLSLEDYKERVRLHIEALNKAVADIPNDRIRMHVCWANYEGPHHKDIPLEEVLPELYEAEVGGLLIEQANPRHHQEHHLFGEYSPPDDWVLMPGVIDVKTNMIEPPEVVADRIERFADLVGDPTRIIAAPDCGFGTIAGLGTVDREIAWAKLDSLVQGADLASGRLF